MLNRRDFLLSTAALGAAGAYFQRMGYPIGTWLPPNVK
jgi:hypothetical protein